VQTFRTMTDLVPQAIRDLLAFYKERYADARFGDLDVTVLESAVGSIDEAAQAVVQAEETLQAARANFREVEIEISQKAARALSFLKIYVDGDPEPLSKLDLIAAAMPSARRKGKGTAEADASPAGEVRQRRPRKSKANDEPVPVLDAAVEADAEALLVAPSESRASKLDDADSVAAAE
jgi:ferritin